MSEANATTVDGVKLEDGVVYLRDRRTGRVHQYQEMLAQLSHIEKFVFDGKLPTPVTLNSPAGAMQLNMTALERAADWDRLASMKPEDREAELQARAAYEEEQRTLTEQVEKAASEQESGSEKPNVSSDPFADSDIELLDRTGPTLAAYRENNWTNELLVEKGLAKAKT